jgi:opacity protein-like surface antigen
MLGRFKSAFGAAALIAGLPGIASAADIPVGMPVKAPPPVVVGYNWTGFYLGGFAAYLDGDVSGDPGHLVNASGINSDGWAVGVMAGYRYQFPNRIVVGAQISAPIWTDDGSAIGTGPIAGSRFEIETKHAILGTLQLGYAFDRFLPFITGGFGAASVESRTFPGGAAPVQTRDVDHDLWTIGFGFDYAVTNNIVVGFRYGYVEASKEDYTVPFNTGVGLSNEFSWDSHAVNFTFAYRFCGGWWGIC